MQSIVPPPPSLHAEAALQLKPPEPKIEHASRDIQEMFSKSRFRNAERSPPNEHSRDSQELYSKSRLRRCATHEARRAVQRRPSPLADQTHCFPIKTNKSKLDWEAAFSRTGEGSHSVNGTPSPEPSDPLKPPDPFGVVQRQKNEETRAGRSPGELG